MLPLLLLLFTSFLRSPAQASPGRPPSCPPKACGNLTVAYPFWLEETGQPPCGSPSFQLRCNGSRAFLSRSIFGLYQVVRVFTQNSSFIVVDNNLQLDDGCPPPHFNISVGIGLGPFVISKSNRELLVLHNCTKQHRAAPQAFLRTPCQNESFFHLGEEPYGSRHDRGNLTPGCSLSVVPFLGILDRNDYVASMRQGFLLEWTVASGDCPKCVASGGQCRFGHDGMGFSCSCSDGVRPEKCGESGEFRKLAVQHEFA